LLALQPALSCSARLRQALVIAAGAELRLINGVSVIAKFDGEHNAIPTPVAAQATLLHRNRQYRPGERTWAAIADRQKFSTLLKMLRAA
jgi:hypothetical protein